MNHSQATGLRLNSVENRLANNGLNILPKRKSAYLHMPFGHCDTQDDCETSAQQTETRDAFMGEEAGTDEGEGEPCGAELITGACL